MEKNYASEPESESKKENVSIETVNKDSILNTLKRLLGKDKEHDIHGLSQFVWP
jgi:hypothetical protein